MSRTYKDRQHKYKSNLIPNWYRNCDSLVGWVNHFQRVFRRREERAKENQALIAGREDRIPFIRRGQDAYDNW